MNRFQCPQVHVVASLAVLLTVFLAGCGSGSTTTSAGFTASTTAPAPGLVKLVEKSRSGSRVVVDVLLFGPETALDLSAFQFGIKIGNSELVKFVPHATYIQTALVADANQTISIDVDGGSDPSLVQVTVEKRGGGAGNGIAEASAVIIELAFEVQAAGATTLTLVGLGGDAPQALDSTRVPVVAVRFDPASAGVRGVTVGGSGY